MVEWAKNGGKRPGENECFHCGKEGKSEIRDGVSFFLSILTRHAQVIGLEIVLKQVAKAVVMVVVMADAVEAVAAWEEVVVADSVVIDRLAVMVDVAMTATEGIAFSQSIIRILSVAVQCVRETTCPQPDTTIRLMLLLYCEISPVSDHNPLAFFLFFISWFSDLLGSTSISIPNL